MEKGIGWMGVSGLRFRRWGKQIGIKEWGKVIEEIPYTSIRIAVGYRSDGF